MRKLTLVAFVFLVIVPMAMASNSEKRVHRAIPLDATGRLSLKTHNGTITVTTWNDANVDIDALIEPGDMGYAEDVQRTEIRISGSGSSVHVESDYSDVGSHLSWFGVNRAYPLVHYTIKMPATARLEIEDHNARVRVTGLRADLEINSHNGEIEVADFEGGADIETHNGDVRVRYSRFTKPGSFQTHNGSFDIRMPAEARFHLNADGHHLGLNCDFPVTAYKMGDGRYVGDVNGGGPELRFTTHNGSLHLTKG